jgi:uncharacterized membrane protein required for colicin V production
VVVTTLDWILLGLIALTALGGYRRGLIGTVLSLVGLAVGAVVGARAAPHFLSGTTESHYSALVGLGGALVGAMLCQALAAKIGSFTRTGLRFLPPLRFLDSLGGLIAGGLCGALLVWVGGAVALQIPDQQKVHTRVAQSHVLRRLDKIAPPHDILRIRTQLGDFSIL